MWFGTVPPCGKHIGSSGAPCKQKSRSLTQAIAYLYQVSLQDNSLELNNFTFLELATLLQAPFPAPEPLPFQHQSMLASPAVCAMLLPCFRCYS